MINYTLKCDNDHAFDSWFQSAQAYEKLAKTGMVSCNICGSNAVSKAIMAPRVNKSGNKDPQPISKPQSKTEKILSELRKNIEKNSEYVGTNFVSEARSIHLGDRPERSIYGEAKPEEAKKLIEDGVPIAPLPFLPSRKSN